MILGWFFLTKNSKLIKLGKGSSVSHPGQGCFRHLWLHSIHCMDGCNVSLTLLFYFSFVLFHSLCYYVLRCFFCIIVSFCNVDVVQWLFLYVIVVYSISFVIYMYIYVGYW
jgi:hypothetical protein